MNQMEFGPIDGMGYHFPTAEELRDSGIRIAIEHAGEEWVDKAMKALELYPGVDKFMIEELRAWAYAHGLERPPHERAWGGITTRAVRKGWIVRVGYEQTSNPLAHKTPAAMWLKTGPRGGVELGDPIEDSKLFCAAEYSRKMLKSLGRANGKL